MIRDHLSAWLTAAFAALLLLLTVSDQGPDASVANVVILLVTLGVLLLFLRTEQALHRPR